MADQSAEHRQEREARGEMTGEVETPCADYMSEWGRRANALSEKAWKYCQIGAGALLGAACAACLFLFESQEKDFLPLNLIAAFLIAKLGPDLLEKWFERKAPTVRIALIAALGALIAAYLLWQLLSGRARL